MKTSFKLTNAIISIGVGLVVTILGLIAYGNRHFLLLENITRHMFMT